jgi:uncharacterized membrane protein
MDSNLRTVVKTFSYRTAVAISIFLAALAMNYSAGFGLTFVIMSYTVGFLSFFVQERIWNLVRWGRRGLRDTKIRSVVKTITWRVWSFFVLFVLGLILGLKSTDAVEWSIVTNVLFLVVHYVHERVWNLIQWGKASENLQEEPA